MQDITCDDFNIQFLDDNDTVCRKTLRAYHAEEDEHLPEQSRASRPVIIATESDSEEDFDDIFEEVENKARRDASDSDDSDSDDEMDE